MLYRVVDCVRRCCLKTETGCRISVHDDHRGNPCHHCRIKKAPHKSVRTALKMGSCPSFEPKMSETSDVSFINLNVQIRPIRKALSDIDPPHRDHRRHKSSLVVSTQPSRQWFHTYVHVPSPWPSNVTQKTSNAHIHSSTSVLHLTTAPSRSLTMDRCRYRRMCGVICYGPCEHATNAKIRPGTSTYRHPREGIVR